MKHGGGCHCKLFSFKSDIDPMLVVQCNCNSCRRLTGSINIGCLYAESEVEFKGETSTYDFADGSGLIKQAHFCPKGHVRVYNKPAPEVMEGMVSTPLGVFNDTNGLVPKVEICREEKLTFLSRSECILESFEGNGIPERLNALLASLDNR